MPAERGGGDAGAEVAGGGLAQGGEDVPDEGRLTLLRHPRLEMVGGHDASEAVLLGLPRQLEDLGGVELLEHRGVTDGGHGSILARVPRTRSRASAEGGATRLGTPPLRSPRRYK